MNKQQLRAQIAALQDATMDENKNFRSAYDEGKFDALTVVDNLLDSLQEELASTAYVVTRCEAHSDYVEEVFFDKDKAQEYCDQFKGNENEYARHITKVKVTL